MPQKPLAARAGTLSRRQCFALPWAAWPGLQALAQAPAAGSPQDGRLVLVFLRGAVDGLSVFVPHADPRYRSLRGSTAIAAPDGSAQTALALDAQFGLHPALAPLWPQWQRGQLAFVPCSGLPQAVRSHFEAQHLWESGLTAARASSGWLNRWAGAQGHMAGPVALGVGESNPEVLRGPAPVQRVPRGKAALNQGASSRDRVQQALHDLYADDQELAPLLERGLRQREQTTRTLREAEAPSEAPTMGAMSAEQRAADNGAAAVAGLVLDARHLATLMQRDPRLRIGFLSAGGWDTHANQGGVQGPLANGLGQLAHALVELQATFSRPNDLIVVASEFGRTAAENGTRGTDHGHGNALWLLGPRVQGGRRHGRWEGLAQGQLNEGRDLPVFHDYRAVMSLLLQRTQGAGDAQLAALFPDAPFAGASLLAGDNRLLAGLLRAA